MVDTRNAFALHNNKNVSDVIKISENTFRIEEFEALLVRQMKLYTMGESSSLPEETAEAIFASVMYTLQSGGDLLQNQTVQSLFKQGQENIEQKIALGKKLLFRAQVSRLAIDNLAYADTYTNLAVFFKQYDYRFFAHDVPCMIDYQLCGGQPQAEGVEYICEYLERLDFENRFCRKFPVETVQQLLQNHTIDFRESILNMFEPVLANAVGLVALNKNPKSLRCCLQDIAELAALFGEMQESKADLVLEEAAGNICAALGIAADFEKAYVFKAADELLPRLMSGGDYGGIFTVVCD